jgi:pSer/pThr/pTyr-binding forkhead associated (FHA) protein
MTVDVSTARSTAGRVAKWLVDKERPDEAVRLLCAWAVAGNNDPEGQQLLAEALRIDPSARIAQMAFERMEGIAGDHGELDAALEEFNESALLRIDAEVRRPNFRRAQMGFNNNIRFQDQVFHVQTEDSGLDQPHVITHLFADGGRVIKSHKRSYQAEVSRPDVAEYVRALMKAQHLEMVSFLREGRFEPILLGQQIGGLETFTDPPNVDIRKLASQKKERAEARAQANLTGAARGEDEPVSVHLAPPRPTRAKSAEAKSGSADVARSAPQAPGVGQPRPAPPRPAQAPASPGPASPAAVHDANSPALAQTALAPTEPAMSSPSGTHAAAEAQGHYFTLHVLRSLTDGPDRYDPVGTRAVVGKHGEISLAGEQFVHAEEAILVFENGALWLEDLEGGNGVFLRIRTPVELSYGDEFVVGDQLLRVEANPTPDDGPDPDPTYFYSSPKWPSSFRIVQVFEGGAVGACLLSRGNSLQIGSALGDLIFPDDPLVGEQHCVVEEQAGTVLLSDLTSRTGVFVRIRGSQELLHGDELLVGRTRLVVDLGQ